jgi:hypothetical protein
MCRSLLNLAAGRRVNMLCIFVDWRGTSAGGQILGSNYHNFTRFRLVDLAQAHTDLVNAKIMRFADSLCLPEQGCDREGIIREYNISGAHAPQEDSYKYKYLLDVDGMTFSGGFLGLLRSGSLVFKVHLPYVVV